MDEWVQETASGLKSVKDRKISTLLSRMKKEDILLVSALSRLCRNLMEVMSILHDCMERDIKVFSVKEGYESGNNINSKVLAFALSLRLKLKGI